MRGVFDDKEFEEPRPGRDPEVTLGIGSVLLILLGLVLLCGLCFGLGYKAGQHGGQSSPAGVQSPAAGPQASLQNNGSRPKPSATAQVVAPPAPTVPQPATVALPGAASLPQSVSAAMTPTTGQQASNSAPQSASTGQLVVRPALPPAANPQQTASASRTQPAAPPAVPIMVQIAAVTHQEDADVLVGALRNHGYAVSARREPADNLIHVRIGPFNDRSEANSWRLKLLNDGYNAMIQP